MTMILFTAVAIVRERERGNLELLINTPVSSAELMIGKVVPYILIGMLQLALILAVGRLLFDVPVRGSIMFPFEGMPLVAQWLGEVLPNTHFIRLTRGIMLRGASIGDLYRDVGYLLGFALVAMTGAALRFTKRLD